MMCVGGGGRGEGHRTVCTNKMYTFQDGGRPSNTYVDSRVVTVTPTPVAIPAPTFQQEVYYIAQPEGDYSGEVRRCLYTL